MLNLEIANRVATLVLERPPVNAINDAWVAAFHARLDELEAREDWAVLHIRSALRVFSAGADLNDIRERFETSHGIAALAKSNRGYQRLFARIEALPRVTIAEIGGAAMGGGLELALACDLRIAAREAKLGLPEVRLGLLPGAGGTQRLARLCGRAVALRLILGAEVLNGAESERLGIAQWSAPAAELPAAAAVLAKHYAELPAHAAAEAKACIALAHDSAEDGFEREVTGSVALLQNAETRALVARFLAGKAK